MDHSVPIGRPQIDQRGDELYLNGERLGVMREVLFESETKGSARHHSLVIKFKAELVFGGSEEEIDDDAAEG